MAMFVLAWVGLIVPIVRTMTLQRVPCVLLAPPHPQPMHHDAAHWFAPLTPTSASLDHAFAYRTWRLRTTWWRWVLGEIGIQGKLVAGGMIMLGIALAAASWVNARQGRVVLSQLAREQAIVVSRTLALASAEMTANNNLAEMQRVGDDLLQGADIAGVGFYDKAGRLLSLASTQRGATRDAPGLFGMLTFAAEELQRPHVGTDAAYGPFVLAIAPVASRDASHGLAGYVAVCIANNAHQLRLARAQHVMLGMGLIAAVIALPIAFVIVHRILLPVRELVVATRQLAAGDWSARPPIYRPDVIGRLARAFDDMACRVQQQQTALAAANRDLEQKVGDRTADLEAANRTLAHAVAEKEDFLRAISHDLGAPLRNIDGMAATLLMKHGTALDADARHRVDRIRKNVAVGTELISELLELSRIKSRRQRIERVDPAVLVSDLVGLFESDLRGRDIKVLIDTPLPVLTCERMRLRQVFQNLIDNAIKYMGAGSGDVREVHVGAAARAGEVEFYVRDTGPGIEPQDADKVFFIFRRGRNRATQQVAGKGVGLASVKSIIETYGGRIWVDSVPGAGSTFRFTINGQHVAATQARAA